MLLLLCSSVVERRTVNAKVTGSNPVRAVIGPIYSTVEGTPYKCETNERHILGP